MITVPSIVSIRPLSHRSYGAMCDMLTFYALFAAYVKTLPSYALGGARMRFSCLAGGMELVYDFKEMIEHIPSGERPDAIHFVAQEALPDIEGAVIHGAQSAAVHISSAVFAFHVAYWNEWIGTNVSTNRHLWPPISNFCRVVRNALVHNGTVNISSPNAPIVNWRGIEYGYSQAGQAVLNVDGGISIGDLILLMIDLDNELDNLGAPILAG